MEEENKDTLETVVKITDTGQKHGQGQQTFE